MHYHLPPIKQGCELLATELTVEERTNTVESLINFACNALQHLRGRALHTTLSVSKLGYFAQFISETITLTPEATPISPKAYYPISCILYTLITKTSPILNGEFINSYLKTYRVQENRKMELTGIIFTQLILLSINNNPNKIIEIPSLITSLSNIQPGWINYLAHEVEINGQKKGVLTALLKMFHSNLAQKSAEILVNLLEQIHNNKDITLPISFLNEIADWQLNLQKRSQLNEQTQNLLATIYNYCIHQTQGTSQEVIFEDLRTQLLIKFNADPTQDSQAIHTKENHEFSKLIYSSWESALGETLAIRTEKYTKGQEILLQYISQKEGEIVKNRLQNESKELTLHFSLYLLGVRGSKYDAPCNSIKSEIMPYEELKNYIQQLTIESQKPTMNNLERQNIQDVKQLLNLISMIAYYTENEQQSPEPFRINDKQEARNILLLELIDQVENPSCAQGPFIRLLIALEPTAEYRFPFLTRRSAQFYVNEYINAFYSQKTVEEQKQLIQQIYAQINDKEMPDEIDYVPEHAFSFLFTQFITEYENRTGDISTKEIETLFSMERPQDYNPLIVAALNQHHQEQLAAKKSSTAQNPNGFFMNNTNGNNDNSSNMDIDMVSYKKG